MGFPGFPEGSERSAFGHRPAQLLSSFQDSGLARRACPSLHSQTRASSHHQHQCCWALNVAHVLVAMVVGYMLAEAPGWANLDGGGGNHLCSGALLALLGASLGDRVMGPFRGEGEPSSAI